MNPEYKPFNKTIPIEFDKILCSLADQSKSFETTLYQQEETTVELLKLSEQFEIEKSVFEIEKGVFEEEKRIFEEEKRVFEEKKLALKKEVAIEWREIFHRKRGWESSK